MSKLFENISRTEIEHLIREWIHNQRDRDVVSRRLLDGIVFEELADEFALSVTQVKTICYKAQRKLLQHISIE